MKQVIIILILLSLMGCSSQVVKKIELIESDNRVQDLQLDFEVNHLEYRIEQLEARVDSLEIEIKRNRR